MVACGRAVAKSLSARSTSLIKCRLTRLGLLPTTTSHQQLRWPCSGRVCTARYATVNAPRDRRSKYNQIFTARCFSFPLHKSPIYHQLNPHLCDLPSTLLPGNTLPNGAQSVHRPNSRSSRGPQRLEEPGHNLQRHHQLRPPMSPSPRP
jgi:hypothetical protein